MPATALVMCLIVIFYYSLKILLYNKIILIFYLFIFSFFIQVMDIDFRIFEHGLAQ